MLIIALSSIALLVKIYHPPSLLMTWSNLFFSAYLVDGIGPVLRLQTEGAVLPVSDPTLPRHRAVQVVGCIELDPRLTGPDLQHTSTGWMRHSETDTYTHGSNQRHQSAPAQCVVLCDQMVGLWT